MSYAEAQKLHDLRPLREDSAPGARDEVLRLVLAIVLDPETAAWCLGCPTDAPIVRWPSTLYRVLARAALQSRTVWRRCSHVVDKTLDDAVLPYAERPPSELAALFLDGRESLSGNELAAVLWCLIRQRCRTRDLIAERLGLELEVVAARRLAQGGTKSSL